MVNLRDLEVAVMYVSFNGGMENEAYLSRELGQFFYDSPYQDRDEDFPDDVADSTKYIRIPSERDLDLGIPLRLDFMKKFAPNRYDEALTISRKPKAYGRLRDLIERIGLLETWYKFQQEALYDALREWCADNELEISESAPSPRIA
jgi:hypothetical protein